MNANWKPQSYYTGDRWSMGAMIVLVCVLGVLVGLLAVWIAP